MTLRRSSTEVPPPRILILVENLPVPFDRRVWMEATTLAEAGYEVSVICPQGSYPLRRETLEGVRIYRYPLPSMTGFAGHLVEYAIAFPATLALTWLVHRRTGFDVIQSANPPDLFFLIARIFKRRGVKFVFDHHDLMPEICESRWHGWRRAAGRHVSLWLERATFRTADRIIATNESYRQIALGRGAVAPQRVSVVRSAPRLSQFRAVAPRGEWKSGRTFLVAYLGVMGPNDGVGHLLASIAHIVHTLRRDDVHFVLIGAGDLQPRHVAEARSLRLDPFVRFTGYIPDDDVLAILSTADVCVAPDPKDALNDVSSMNKVVEYMALAKPLVAYDLREARASAAEAGVYARPNDPVDFAAKIIELLASPERRSAMGKAGRARVESALAWEHQSAVLLAMYRDLVGAARRPS